MEGGEFRDRQMWQLTPYFPSLTTTLSHSHPQPHPHPHPHQTHLISGTLVTQYMQSGSHHSISFSQDQFVQSLYPEINIRNSRIQAVEHMNTQIRNSTSRLIPTLLQEIDQKSKRNAELKHRYMEKDATNESACRQVARLLWDTNQKNMEISALKQAYNEMCMLHRKQLHENNLLRNQATKMRMMNLQNKRLKSELKLVEKELEQLIQGTECAQSLQRQGCSAEKNMNVVDFQIRVLKRQLEDKRDEVDYLQDLNGTLLLREHKSNNELLDARSVLLTGLQSILTNRTMLEIKRMGELNPKPFHDACALRFPDEEWGIKSAEVCSLWEEYQKDSNWHPFKHTILDGKVQEVIDEKDEDERLEELRKEWGEEAYEAVKDALMELNQYNPSGRYPVPEIWNFKEERKVSLKEVIGYMIQLVKTHKRKRW